MSVHKNNLKQSLRRRAIRRIIVMEITKDTLRKIQILKKMFKLIIFTKVFNIQRLNIFNKIDSIMI